MRPDRLPHPQSLISVVTTLGESKVELELFVLKCHLLVERQMYSLLAMRLGVPEHNLPPLNYLPLAKLSLCGEDYKDTLLAVLALNDLRNEYGHELHDTPPEKQMKTLAQRTGTFWPQHPAMTKREAWEEPRDRSVRAACIFCLGDLWVHITERAQADDLYSSPAVRQQAAEELERFKKGQKQRRQDERDLGPWFEDLLRHAGVV